MNTQHIMERLTAAVLGLFFLASLGFQLYAINKGFDITDEGYNLQLGQSKFVGISNTYFFETVQLLFGWLPQTLFVNRIIASILLVGSAVFFMTAAFQFFKISFSAVNVFFCLLSIPFAVTLDPVTLSYNNLTATFTLFSGGCLFQALAQPDRLKQQLLLVFLSGVCAAIVCVSKITSGFALVITILCLILFVGAHKWKTIPAFITGWLFYMLIHGYWFTPFHVQLQHILTTGKVFAQMDGHYDQSVLIKDAWIFIRDHFVLGLHFVALFVAARLIRIQMLKILIWILAVAYAYYCVDQNEYRLTGLVYIITVLISGSFFIVQVTGKDVVGEVRRRYKQILPVLFVIALPLFVVLGTNNVYYHNFIFACMPLSVFCVYLLDRGGVACYKQALLLFTAGWTFYICYTKILNQPYRILPLAQQTEKADQGVLSGIKLDPAATERYQRLRQTMSKSGFTKENGLICLGKMQGIQYLLEASSPGGVMFSPTFRELYLMNLALDTNSYKTPCFVISDYRFADSLIHDSPGWENRFTQALAKQQQQSISWNLTDSVQFETAPLGVLYVYKTE
jgi:hypothetical protein